MHRAACQKFGELLIGAQSWCKHPALLRILLLSFSHLFGELVHQQARKKQMRLHDCNWRTVPSQLIQSLVNGWLLPMNESNLMGSSWSQSPAKLAELASFLGGCRLLLPRPINTQSAWLQKWLLHPELQRSSHTDSLNRVADNSRTSAEHSRQPSDQSTPCHAEQEIRLTAPGISDSACPAVNRITGTVRTC